METISTNWLEQFKLNIVCGPFPAKTSNPLMEMMTGYTGLYIERLLKECPDAEIDPVADDANIEGGITLGMWYRKIQCGDLFESDAQAWAVLAMAEKLWLDCETAQATLPVSAPVITAGAAAVSEEQFDSDQNTLVLTDAAAIAYTISEALNTELPVGAKLKLIQGGAGVITFDVAGAPTVVGTFVTTGQWDVLFIEKIGPSVWHSALLVA